MISFQGKLVTDEQTDEWADERQQIYRTNLPKVGGSKNQILDQILAYKRP